MTSLNDFATTGDPKSTDGPGRAVESTPGLATHAGCTAQDCEALYTLGHRLYGQSRYLEALNVFGMLVMLKSLEHRFVFGFGSCLQMLGRYEEAINHYGTALFVDIDDPAPLLHTCECLLALGQKEHAHDALKVLQTEYSHDQHPGVMEKAAKLSALMSSGAVVSTGRKQ